MDIPSTYWLHHATFYVLLLLIHYLNGLLVVEHNVKVNYTRKINHFAFFFLPTLLSLVIEYPYSAITFFMDMVCAFIFLGCFAAPLRKRSKLLWIMFRSFDRPEDRPYTLLWLYTQFIASYAVLIPLLAYFESHEMLPLLMIIIIANGIGDGLAEPIGIRFGQRKYATYALFTKQRYVRSYAGSACVFVTTLIAVIAFHSYFNPAQLLAACVTLPLLITLAEAFSPHTWDSPLIYVVGGCSLIAIMQFL
ncbi:hypothetical protein ABF87_09560 [Nitrosomonas sp. JL21]|uniref:hypothetical protein n=1 Tax=Nitrosomonas sp. JL21 TaxID=153949 RepID=UPI0013703306|nr:hypothetical protein [Nitrosomonas sp. JL21]MBL8498373.1 hypothetical protein [Nitrosomonas sp.]MCC7091955.1 hypothetical protein [Nitrosomonas sp.]MXS78201.1 hypothetical protein [Nitrosomonas sp. JL21]